MDLQKAVVVHVVKGAAGVQQEVVFGTHFFRAPHRHTKARGVGNFWREVLWEGAVGEPQV